MDPELKEYLDGRFDRLATAFAGNLTDVRNEVITRLDLSDRRMDSIERTMGHLNLTVSQLDVKVSSLNRLITGMQHDNQAVLSNQTALQRLLDDLAARVKKLEERA